MSSRTWCCIAQLVIFNTIEAPSSSGVLDSMTVKMKTSWSFKTLGMTKIARHPRRQWILKYTTVKTSNHTIFEELCYNELVTHHSAFRWSQVLRTSPSGACRMQLSYRGFCRVENARDDVFLACLLACCTGRTLPSCSATWALCPCLDCSLYLTST
jgi:hypothetical protein